MNRLIILILLLLICNQVFGIALIDTEKQFITVPIINETYNEKSRIWISTQDGFSVFHLKKNRFLSMKINPLRGKDVTSITKFSNTIWIATFGGGLFKIQGGKFINFTNENSGLMSNYINKIITVKDTSLKEFLIIATSEGISVLDSSETWSGFTKYDGLLSNNIKDLRVIGNNIFSISTLGIQKISMNEGKIDTIYNDGEISDILFWKNKYWVGTINSGVLRFDNNFKFVDVLNSSNSGLKCNQIVKIKKYDGKIFFLTPKGIFIFNNIYWKNDLKSKSYLSAKDFVIYNDTVYVATTCEGLLRDSLKKENSLNILGTLVNKSKKPFYERWIILDKYFKGAKINDICYKPSSMKNTVDIFVATDKGFFQFFENGKKIKRINKSNSSLKTNYIKKIAFKNYPYSGRYLMFLSTYGNGLYRYDGSSLDNIRNSNGLLSNYVYGSDYINSKNEFWFGTEEGINRYNQKDWKGYYNLSINLFQKVKKTCFFDGKYYFATDFGVGYFDGRKWGKIGLKEGLNDMVITDIIPDNKKKKLYIGTHSGGLYRWNGKNVLKINIPGLNKRLLGFNEIKSICLHNDKIYVTFKNSLIEINSRHSRDLKKDWKLPDGTLKKVVFGEKFIFIVYDYKLLFTKYHKWEKL